MAVEAKRGCGYRHVDGMYLVGGTAFVGCDRLPIKIGVCPVCGAGIHFSRGIGKINPAKLWGKHEGSTFQAIEQTNPAHCLCVERCNVCYPPDELAFIMFVGEKYYTVQEFAQEAISMGVSKRIPAYPEGLIPGKPVVYLAHKKCIALEKKEDGKEVWLPGIFAAFIPQRVEKLCWQSNYTPENIAAHEKRGITLIPIPDGDPDHTPSKKKGVQDA